MKLNTGTCEEHVKFTSELYLYLFKESEYSPPVVLNNNIFECLWIDPQNDQKQNAHIRRKYLKLLCSSFLELKAALCDYFFIYYNTTTFLTFLLSLGLFHVYNLKPNGCCRYGYWLRCMM